MTSGAPPSYQAGRVDRSSGAVRCRAWSRLCENRPVAVPPVVEVRHFKWPRRPTSIATARLLGEDEFGVWLGVAAGAPWWTADRSPGGLFAAPLVKLVP